MTAMAEQRRRVSEEKDQCVCGSVWEAHRVISCPGSLACGGYRLHDCATPGCMEPEFGVHSEQCPGFLITCPQ